jgi:hypothetical protein
MKTFRRTDKDTFNDKYDRYSDSYRLLNISMMVLGAVYIAHWVDVYFFTRPDFDKLDRKALRARSRRMPSQSA